MTDSLEHEPPTDENGSTTFVERTSSHSLDSPRSRMEAALFDTQKARSTIASEVRDLERNRAVIDADIAEYEARAAAERARLAHRVTEAAIAHDAAAEDSRYDDRLSAEAEGRMARDELAGFEATIAERTARLRRDAAAIDVMLAPLLEERLELDRRLASLSDELRRYDADEQASRAAALEAQLEKLAPVVEAQREAVGAIGAADLSADYASQADHHAGAWKIWGGVLIVALACAVAGSLLLFHQDSVPEGKLTNGVVVEITRNLLIVGLLVYGVRLSSLQFRVHRHLEAVARNKAVALSTFNRMVVVATEPEIRNSLATVLAQSVFNSEETGFVDATGDHITLVERIAGSLPRPSS